MGFIRIFAAAALAVVLLGSAAVAQPTSPLPPGQWVIAQQEINQLIMRELRFYDQQDYAGLAALFTDDGHYKSQDGDVIGRPAIQKALGGRPKTRLTRHVVTNVIVTFTGPDTADASTVVTVYLNDAGFPYKGAVPEVGSPAVGDYDFKFRKVHGVWLIAEKVTHPVFVGYLPKKP